MADKPGQREELVFLPLGGIGEIGMNVYLYGYGRGRDRRWIMVDLGVTFPGENEPGADVILPDLKFIEEERDNLLGIVITHAHEDHYGAVLDLWPSLGAPIYATPFTLAMLAAKRDEYASGLDLPVHEIATEQRFQLGPFDLELVNMAHSIPEPSALVIRTPAGTAFHTGDWKLDPDPITGPPTNEARIREIGHEGIDVLVCDSTNVFREGVSPSEADVAASLAQLIAKAKGRVAVTTFSSNVARIRSVAEAAKAAGREFVVIGRAMHRVIRAAQDTGYFPPEIELLNQDQFGYLPKDKVVALITGSQGEARAALARIAEDSHPAVALSPGDIVVFSSRTIPGNERSVGAIQNKLVEQGVRLVTDRDALVHVTGHPRRDELARMYEWTKPRAAIPMHGEARHLVEHKRFAEARGVKTVVPARNGQIVRLCPGVCEAIDEAPVGRRIRDGKLIVPAHEGPVRERRRLSFVGIVVISVVLDKRGEIACDPDVVIDGVPYEDRGGEAMEDVILDEVEGALESIPRPRRRDIERVEDAVRRAARAAINAAWGKRPICKVLVSVV